MPSCPKELTKQKQASPGVVESSETLVYMLLNPDHWENGKLKKAAFSKSKLKEGDLSVCRADYCTADGAYEHAVKPQLERNPARQFVGALRALCADIRGIAVDDPPKQAICVIDDGLDSYPAHALLAYSDATKSEKFWLRNNQEAVRANLTLVFGINGGPLPLRDCFRQA
jgi:hypothetical protein